MLSLFKAKLSFLQNYVIPSSLILFLSFIFLLEAGKNLSTTQNNLIKTENIF